MPKSKTLSFTIVADFKTNQAGKVVGDLDVKFKNASQTLKQFGINLGNVGKTSRKTAGAFSGLIQSGRQFLVIFGVFSSIKRILGDVAGLISGVSKAIFNLTEEAAKLRDSEIAFRRLVGAAGNANVILARTYAEVEGVVERVEAVGAATRAALTGLPMERFSELAKGARALAAATGRDASEAIDRLTNSIAKQERRLLDELGIVVRADDIYRQYGRSINVAATQLTAAQKKYAFFEAVLGKVNEKVMALGGAVDQAQLPFNQLRASVRALRVSFGGAIDRILGVSELTALAARGVGKLADRFNSLSETAAESTGALLRTGDAIGMYADKVPDLVSEASNILKLTVGGVENNIAANARLKEITQSLVGLFPQYADILKNNVAEGLKAVANETKNVANAQRILFNIKLRKAIEDNAKAYDDAKKNLEHYQRAVDSLSAARDNMLKSGLAEEELWPLELEELGTSIGYVREATGRGLTKYKASLEDVSQSADYFNKKLISANDTMNMQALNIASVVKELRDKNVVTQEEIDAISDSTKSKTDHALAVANLATKTGLSTEQIEDSTSQIVAATQATKDLGDATQKTAEEIDKMMGNLNKGWKLYSDTLYRASDGLSKVANEEIKLHQLQSQSNTLRSTMIENMMFLPEASDKFIDDMLSSIRHYYEEVDKAGSISDVYERQSLLDTAAALKATLEASLDQMGLNIDSFEKLFAVERSITDQEAKLNAARAEKIINIAKLKITTNKDTARSAVDAAKFELQTWRSVYSQLEDNALFTFNLKKQINDEILKADAGFQKAMRKQQETDNNLMLKTQTDAIGELEKITGNLIGLTGSQVDAVFTDLFKLSDDLPDYYKDIAKEVEVLATSVSGKADETISREAVLGVRAQLRERIRGLRDEYAAMMGDLPEYAPFVKRLEDVLTDMDSRIISIQQRTALKINDTLEDLSKARADIISAETVKRVNALEYEHKRRVEINKFWLEGNTQVEEQVTALTQDAIDTRNNIRIANEKETLGKISDATTFNALRTAERIKSILEYSQEGIDRIREAGNVKFKELFDEQAEILDDALKAQAGLEYEARIGKIKKEGVDRYRQLRNLKREAIARKASAEDIAEVDSMIAFNRLNVQHKIAYEERKMQRDLDSERLALTANFTNVERLQAQMRMDAAFEEFKFKAAVARSYYNTVLTNEENSFAKRSKAREKIAQLDTDIANLNKWHMLATDKLGEEMDRRSSDRVLNNLNRLADFLAAHDEFSKQISIVEAGIQRDAMIAYATDYIINTKERAIVIEAIHKSHKEKLLDIEENYWDAVKRLSTKEQKRNFAVFQELTDTFSQFGDTTSESFGGLVRIFEKFHNVLTKVKEVVAVFKKGGDFEKYLHEPVMAVADLAFDLAAIIYDQHNRIKDQLAKNTEEIKQMMVDVAADIGREIGDTLSSNLEVDFEQLVETFVKAQIAERISKIFTDEFGELFLALERSSQAFAPNQEDINKITAQMWRQFDMQGELGLRRMIEMTWSPQVAVPALKELDKALVDGILTKEELDHISETILKLRFGLLDSGDIVNQIFDKYKEQEPRMKQIVGAWEKATGFDFDDEEEKEKEKDIDKTFEGMVTEAQANQMIVLLGRQVDYLNEIANNTYQLTKMALFTQSTPEPVVDVPAALPIAPAEAALAPGLNTVNVNEKLVIEINGEHFDSLNSIDDMDATYLANAIDVKKHDMIQRRDQAVGRWERRRRVAN